MEVESTKIFWKEHDEENLPDILESQFGKRSRLMSVSSTYYTASSSESMDTSPIIQRNVKLLLDKPEPEDHKNSCPPKYISTVNISMGSPSLLLSCPEDQSQYKSKPEIETQSIQQNTCTKKPIIPVKYEIESDGRSNSSASSNESQSSSKEIALFGIESFNALDQLQAKFPLYATFKLIWLGDSGVGKTSLINQFLNQNFRFDYKPTLGVDFATKTISGPDDTVIKLQLWDISGQDRFRFLSRAYYRGAHGCLLVFDRTNRISFHNVAAWKEELDSKVYTDRNEINVPIFLLANKCDLESVVTDLEIHTLCQDKHFNGWASVSAVSGINVEASLETLSDMMIQQEIIRQRLPPGGNLLQKEPKSTCNCS